MQYALDNVRPHNLPCHDDIEKDIQNQLNGNFNFTLRINNGNIVDYSVVEYTNARKYLTSKLVITELTIARHYRKGNPGDTMGNNNHKCSVKGWNCRYYNLKHS